MESWIILVKPRTSYRPNMLLARKSLQESVSHLSHRSPVFMEKGTNNTTTAGREYFLLITLLISTGKSLAVLPHLWPSFSVQLHGKNSNHHKSSFVPQTELLHCSA